MKINFKTMRKKEIKVGDKVTLIPGYEREKYVSLCSIKEGQIFEVTEIRPADTCELNMNVPGGLAYYQNKKHFKVVE